MSNIATQSLDTIAPISVVAKPLVPVERSRRDHACPGFAAAG